MLQVQTTCGKVPESFILLAVVAGVEVLLRLPWLPARLRGWGPTSAIPLPRLEAPAMPPALIGLLTPRTQGRWLLFHLPDAFRLRKTLGACRWLLTGLVDRLH